MTLCHQVRIRCAHQICKEYDLCVPCFSEAKASRDHDPQTHPFSVIEQHSIPIFTDDWGADEETLLLEGAETYGLGSWADIADHIGGYRDKDEVRDHYISTYVNSSKFPLPEHASPQDIALTEEWPREKFLARKKRRVEERKDDIQNAPPAAPKQKPTSSVPSCHEVQGYMPGRLEFEHEHFNEAEEAVQHMQFDPGEGEGQEPRGSAPDEVNLKMVIMNVYNTRLTARVERKKIIFEHQLLDYRKNTAVDKKRSKEERDLHNKAKPFARLMKHQDFEDFTQDLEYELNLRQAIAQLQDWRQMRISDLKSGEKYEAEKSQRAAKAATASTFDRFSTSSRVAKPVLPVETPSSVVSLTAPDLSLKMPEGLATPPPSMSPRSGPEDKRVLTATNGNAVNGSNSSITYRPKLVIPPIPNIIPLQLTNENAPGLHILAEDERALCEALRIFPKPYLVMKDAVVRESQRFGGIVKKKAARDICRIDSTKAGRLYDFWVASGWIGKA